MPLPIQNVAGLLRFPGESAGGVTIGAQNIGGQLIILLPNTDPVVDQVLTVDSVSGTSVITKWATPESSGPESNETWLGEFGGGVSINSGPTLPTGQAAEFYMFDNVGATLEAKLATGTVSIVTHDSDSGSISILTEGGQAIIELNDHPAPSNGIFLSPNLGSLFEAKTPANVSGYVGINFDQSSHGIGPQVYLYDNTNQVRLTTVSSAAFPISNLVQSRAQHLIVVDVTLDNPFNSNVFEGNLLIVGAGAGFSADNTLGTPTDTLGTVWTALPVAHWTAQSNSGNIYMWWGIAPSSGPNTVTITAANPGALWSIIAEYPNQEWTALQNYISGMKTAVPGLKVVVATVTPQTSSTFNTNRASFNALLSGSGTTVFDALADFAGDPIMGPDAAASNLTYYSDGVHPTAAGHAILAPIMKAAIESLE